MVHGDNTFLLEAYFCHKGMQFGKGKLQGFDKNAVCLLFHVVEELSDSGSKK